MIDQALKAALENAIKALLRSEAELEGWQAAYVKDPDTEYCIQCNKSAIRDLKNFLNAGANSAR